MNRGRSYSFERRFFRDAGTGAETVQLTSFPCVNIKLYFHVNAFTPDSQTLVFQTCALSSRDSKVDIFKVQIDGTGLTQLTDDAEAGSPVVSPDGRWLYYVCHGELRQVSMSDYSVDTVGYIDGIQPSTGLSSNTAGTTINASMSSDGRVYFTDATLKNGRRAILRYTTDGKAAAIIYESDSITHTQCEPAEAKIVAFQHGPDDKNRNIWLINEDGTNPRPLDLPFGNGHWMWLGNTGKIMSNLEKQCHGIAVMGEGDEAPELIATGEHFWHAASSRDGQWMVSDTSWPDNGIQLIHVGTKKYATLCYPESSNSHPQWSHPHPSFSPDGSYVVYNSDRSGTPHIYLVKIPAHLKEELQTV
ncbi:PD40 domain-containing protein [Paenibacillus sp. UNC451MF]|uniref:PD40 domain-containing protein n=1 Tax=Paenibacillus sp. UNC451MF TaxID=1449063 RepID=UPI0004904FEB|nr:PD40 domain-containing protein [Paenibacillus sp. UNC451MF]